MAGKITASQAKAAPEVLAAAAENHHLVIGPGQPALGEWAAAGLTLPDIAGMQQYRLDRVRQQLRERDLGGVILMDPLNIRYATDTTNMQVWVMHNATRYCWVGADDSVILWDFFECEFLGGHNPLIDEIRPATGINFFVAGHRQNEKARKWAAELADVVAQHAGNNERIAVDQCTYQAYQALEQAGVTIENGQELMEMARRIKGPDELLAMRCAVNACETTMTEMHEALTPGMTEREVWAMLHAGNIRRAGEWIETQIISSGPRTNPWMQEASSRVIQDGELLAYDTDLVGAYGLMVDISRTWLVGDGKPNPAQANVFSLAREQLERNFELLTVGRSFYDLVHDAWFPDPDQYRHYCCLFHGVGQCDEYPEIFFPDLWETDGCDGVVEANMVFTVEAYVGSRDGGEGVKLENQVLVTESGPELLTHLPLDL